jgi:acetyl esterase
MSLHPQARAVVTARQRPALSIATLGEARAALADSTPADSGPPVPVALVRDLDAAGVPARLYDPRPGNGGPVVVYLHGGGWTVGSIDTIEPVCRMLAAHSGCAVLAPGYRLAPEHPWPAAIEDVDTVLAWLAARVAEPGGGSTPVALAGDSAGAHLATIAAARARDAGRPVAFQALVYPALDPAMSHPSYMTMNDYTLDADEMSFFWDCLLPPGTDRAGPDVAPLNADLRGLPPTLIITAEYDVLRDEGEAYAEALAEAGVPVVAARYQGMVHGFFRRIARYDAAVTAIEQVAAAAARALGETSAASAPAWLRACDGDRNCHV